MDNYYLSNSTELKKKKTSSTSSNLDNHKILIIIIRIIIIIIEIRGMEINTAESIHTYVHRRHRRLYRRLLVSPSITLNGACTHDGVSSQHVRFWCACARSGGGRKPEAVVKACLLPCCIHLSYHLACVIVCGFW
jgi:hypothetical protein